MRSIIVSMVLVVFTAACAQMPSNGINNVLVVGGYADGQQMSRGGAAFNRTQDAFADSLQGEGFNVYDETAVGGGVDWTWLKDHEVIDQVRLVRSPPMDAVVVFSLFADYKNRGYRHSIYPRVSGYVLSVPDGRYLGDFDVDLPGGAAVPKKCSSACFSDVIGDAGRALAQEAGAIVALKLQNLKKRSGKRSKKNTRSDGGLASSYVMTFDGFGARTLDDIEDRLTRLKGYRHLRVLNASYARTKYWYETSANDGALLRSVRQVVDDEGVSARVTFSRGTFEVTNISRRKVRD